jgi:DNA-binding NarL/FixJ family response regulator
MDLIAANAELAEDDESLIEQFKEACPPAGLVVYNGTCEKTEQRRLRRVGADSYMSEASDLSAVIRAIERVMNGS